MASILIKWIKPELTLLSVGYTSTLCENKLAIGDDGVEECDATS